MKFLIVFLALVAVCSAKALEADVPESSNYVEFVKGLLAGINEQGDINQLMECLKDGEELMKMIMEAIKLIATKKIENIIVGVADLIRSVKTLLDMLKPCASGFTELQKLINAVVHADFKAIVAKIIANLGYFVVGIISAIKAYEAGDFYNAGKYVGALLDAIFLQ